MLSQLTPPAAESNELYTSSKYLEATQGTWHLEDSAFKAKYVRRLAEKHNVPRKSVCEIGCGAGGVLAAVSEAWGTASEFVGYEISPQAHQLSRQFVRPNVYFKLGDVFEDGRKFDLALVMDVVEHVEDCFAFLRQVREKCEFKLYHFPLEITCSTAFRDNLVAGYAVGHIHHFSRQTALQSLRYTGHEIVDWMYTPVGLERPKLLRTRAMNLMRRILPTDLAARLVGGYSLMILAK